MRKNPVTRREFVKWAAAGAALSGSPPSSGGLPERPNILWITSEDNSPLLGCYGDPFATTPHLDRLASEGIVYDNAFANAPVCAPARFTILTGMYASTMGTHPMRSRYAIPDFVKPYPSYLRRAGYYCTNPGKTDYNYLTDDKSHWDKGTYHDRKPGQPFFHVVNIGVSHESSLHKEKPSTRHDPAKVILPPYHPDTPEIRQNWAQYYDQVEEMDQEVGKILDQLEKDGLAEDTIVFYYADNGGVLCRSKRFLYDTGTRIPMIIRFPEKYRHLAPGKPGSRTDRLVSFVDLAPTLLSLAGIEIPAYMEGQAFLGSRQPPPRRYVYLFRGRMDERIDMMRAVRDKQYKYIRNYLPQRIYGQHLEYLWRAAATRSWEREYREGRCNAIQSAFWRKKPPEELYDVTGDPWEVHNLAGDPRYQEILERLRRETTRWARDSRDTGFLPEGEMIEQSRGSTLYERVRQKDFPMERILETAEGASLGNVQFLPELIKRLNDKDPSVRYWAATGCAVLGPRAEPAATTLKERLDDESGDVRIVAAEALCGLGEYEQAVPALVRQFNHPNAMTALHAANVLEALGPEAVRALPAMESRLQASQDEYLQRALGWTVQRLRENG
ncbi:MAG: sulfatase-like hydrolase/transferase [bacterium]